MGLLLCGSLARLSFPTWLHRVRANGADACAARVRAARVGLVWLTSSLISFAPGNLPPVLDQVADHVVINGISEDHNLILAAVRLTSMSFADRVTGSFDGGTAQLSLGKPALISGL